jgi:hypothetical protein
MKVTIKSKTEAQERVTLRFSASLKRRMDETHALAERKGADYYASIVDVIASANEEIHERLLQMPDKIGDKSSDESGDRSGHQPGDRSGDRISSAGTSSESPARHINGTSTK